jgi:hypothetical protein
VRGYGAWHQGHTHTATRICMRCEARHAFMPCMRWLAAPEPSRTVSLTTSSASNECRTRVRCRPHSHAAINAATTRPAPAHPTRGWATAALATCAACSASLDTHARRRWRSRRLDDSIRATHRPHHAACPGAAPPC